MKKPTIHSHMRGELKDKALFEQAKQYAFAYIEEVSHRAVFPAAKAVEDLNRFDEPLPESSHSGADTLEMLNAYGAPATVAQTGGRYFGFVNGGVVPTALAARWMADAWDQNPALYVISPVVGKLEQVCENWLRELLELPAGTVAGYVSGSSTATLCGLAAARYELLKRLGWDVNAQGLFGAPPIRVIVSEQAHGSVFKALALLGLGRDRIERVPADDQGRIDASRIPDLDAGSLLILQAGNVNTGAFDAFAEICAPAKKNGAWVHVDGAFGLWVKASQARKALVQDVELADSWSVDGHKTLNTPYDCGIVLCRQRDSLVAAMQASGTYIQYSDNRDGMMHVPEMSRRARAVDLWATIKYLGRRGIEELIDGMCDRAAQFAEQLAAHDFRILNDLVFNQVLVAGDTPSQTRATLANIQASGVCWCGGTEWNNKPAIRISVSSWATTPDDVDRSVKAFCDARSKAMSDTGVSPSAIDAGQEQPLRAKGLKYDQVEEAFIFLSMTAQYENYAYLDNETGEAFYVSEYGDSYELPEDLEENDKYIEVPHKNELDLGRNLVFDFVASHLPDEFDRVRDIFRRRGAYRKYKDLLDSRGKLQAWYDFEQRATEAALREWCRDNGIALTD